MDGTAPPQNQPKTTPAHNKSESGFKKPKGRAIRKKKVKLSSNDDDSDDEENESFVKEKNNRGSAKKSSQNTRTRRNIKKVLFDSDSD